MSYASTLFPRNVVSTLAAAALTLTLSACGGGGGSSAPAATETTKMATAVYFTDDVSADYDAVWITVSRVTVVNPAGETQIAAFSPGKLLNLSTLRSSGALFASAAIPVDATSVRVYVGTPARLQKLDGSMLDVSLSAPSGYLEFKLDGWNSASGALALDFDLPRFTLQGTTLIPATRIASNDDFSRWNQRYAEVEGTVTQVSTTSMTVSTGNLGQRVFVLDGNTTFVSRRSTSWTPAVGDQVEVVSSVTGQGATGLQFTARAVKDETGGAANSVWEVEGRVTAINGTNVTVTIARSDNPGATGSVTFDIAQASFKRGSAAAIVPGVRVEAYLVQQGSAWTASAIEIEGAAKPGASTSMAYVEVRGRIVSATGSTVVVATIYTERYPGLTPGQQITVNLAGAIFDRGAVSCLVAGAPIEIKGYLDAGGVLQPVKADVEGACADDYPVSGVTPPGVPSTPTVAVSAEAKGTVAALRSGEFDMNVFHIEYDGPRLTTVTVRYGATTVFKNVSPSTLATGTFVDVKGSFKDGVITATKVELDD